MRILNFDKTKFLQLFYTDYVSKFANFGVKIFFACKNAKILGVKKEKILGVKISKFSVSKMQKFSVSKMQKFSL